MTLKSLKTAGKIELTIDYGALSEELFEEFLKIVEKKLDMSNYFRTFTLCSENDVNDYCKRTNQESDFTKNHQIHTLTKEEKIIYTNENKTLEIVVAVSFIEIILTKDSFNELENMLSLMNNIFEYISTISCFRLENIYVKKMDSFICKNKKTINKAFKKTKTNYDSFTENIERKIDGFNILINKEISPADSNREEVYVVYNNYTTNLNIGYFNFAPDKHKEELFELFKTILNIYEKVYENNMTDKFKQYIEDDYTGWNDIISL